MANYQLTLRTCRLFRQFCATINLPVHSFLDDNLRCTFYPPSPPTCQQFDCTTLFLSLRALIIEGQPNKQNNSYRYFAIFGALIFEVARANAYLVNLQVITTCNVDIARERLGKLVMQQIGDGKAYDVCAYCSGGQAGRYFKAN